MSEWVPLPREFLSSGCACGLKADPVTLDLALFVSEAPCTAVGVFTQNQVCGAPVKVSRERVPCGTTRAVIINSGNANACTGRRGLDDARWMTDEVARRLGCDTSDVLVCSTGVIGHFLPRNKLVAGIPVLVELLAGTPESFLKAARGMMTTDTVPKQAYRTMEINGREVRVSGAAKGAAMIAPNMATMLSVIMTDAQLAPDQADRMLRHAVNHSFNCISVEGHMSTSDSVILLANGASGVEPGDEQDRRGLQRLFEQVTQELAHAIVRDAEGADHFVTVQVSGLPTRADALQIAKTIANDALVKTAIAGNDPNGGRILSCCGRTPIELTENDIKLLINGALIFDRGAPAEYDPESVARSMREAGDVLIELEFPFGERSARVWTSDLTKEYVRLNSEHTT